MTGGEYEILPLTQMRLLWLPSLSSLGSKGRLAIGEGLSGGGRRPLLAEEPPGMVFGSTGPSWTPSQSFRQCSLRWHVPQAAQVITITLEFETYCDKDSLIGQTLLRLP